MSILSIQRDTISGQTKGCWACLQVGYTRVLFHSRRRDFHAGAWLHVFIASPKKYPEGYRRRRFAVQVRKP